MKAKVLAITLLLVILLAGTAFAAKPVVKADNTYYDVNTGQYVLNGNVYIEVGNRVITAGEARVNMASMEVWASGGITVTQDDIYFTGSNVYVYGKDQAQITGGVSLSRPGLQITADTVDYNWRSKIAVFSGNVAVAQNGSNWSADSVTYDVANNSIQ